MTAEQLANLNRYQEFCRSIIASLKTIASRYGMVVSGDDERQSLSMYVRLYTVDDDGCRDERVAEARISDHRQSHGGPDWSFEVTDSEESIARGLAEIERIAMEW